MTPRAMLFTGAGQPLQPLSQSTAPPTGSEIRVRILCCTLCRSDLATYSGLRIEATPTVLGHEVVGAIEAFGPSAQHLDAAGQAASIGDRITWAIVAPCNDCFHCKSNLSQKCEHGLKYGHHRTSPDRPDGGGLAGTITLVPGTDWFLVPAHVSTAVASLANCAGATVAAILEAAGPVAGRSVLIHGAGVLGITACAMAASLGARAILAIDPDRGCRERAPLFGADPLTRPPRPRFRSRSGCDRRSARGGCCPGIGGACGNRRAVPGPGPYRWNRDPRRDGQPHVGRSARPAAVRPSNADSPGHSQLSGSTFAGRPRLPRRPRAELSDGVAHRGDIPSGTCGRGIRRRKDSYGPQGRGDSGGEFDVTSQDRDGVAKPSPN